jgi:DEAD/DEAH box helicase domain-containing protein
VIITTPTASGKTLAFNIPVFECLVSDPKARALYLYPTKALTNDQYSTLHRMEKYSGIHALPAIYDGDTPQSKRSAIRENSRIIISNPHELHHMLSWHPKWNNLFSNLRYIVMDEAHRYRGVFGSHIALLIRRLLRICRHYGSHPQFVLSTATIANPDEFATRLTGRTFRRVDADGSPHGRKHFVLYNPFFDGLGERSMHQETKDLILSSIRSDLQTLCFTGSRKMAELVGLWAREDAKRLSAHLAESIATYRAGYLPEDRRAIEKKLKDGTLKGLVSTNALELGIDIGSLDVVILSGYPGTMMSTRQQAGRSGRNGGESLAILVASANPLDQYFMHHPDLFFSRSHEHAIVDPENPYIVSGHLLCAAAELPLKKADAEFFGSSYHELCMDLESHCLIRETSRGGVYAGRGRAAELVRLDGTVGETFRVMCNGQVIETLDRGQAYREAHKGAIMLHQGEMYLVKEMDLEMHSIKVVPADVDYYTQPLKEVNLEIIGTQETRIIDGVTFSFGDVEVTEQYTGYKIKRKDTIIGFELLSLPPLTFRTKALWVVFSDDIMKKITGSDLDPAGGLHGAEHAIIALMPFHVMCDRWDIGGLSSPSHGENGEPVIFVYDACEGGIGLCETAFTMLPEIFSRSFELVRNCRCESGCPSCIHSPKCGNDNQPLDKQATVLILDELHNLKFKPIPECHEMQKNTSLVHFWN